jgi:PKD repeat protein
LPFPYSYYGQAFSSATVSANGNLQFGGAANSSANACLPASGFAESIFAFWDNLRTDGVDGPAQGIYTSTSGASPNRVFNIEWRASYFHPGRHGALLNFEIRLFENQSRFDLVYGTLNGDGSTATVGAQKSSTGPFTQFECNAGGLSTGLQLTFQTICPDGGGACGGATVANFAGGPTNGAAPLTVSFTNLSSGATSYLWDFGDGHASTAQHPVNVYANPGSYTVTLTAIGTGGANSRTRTNYIVAVSPAQLVVTPSSLDFGLIATGATKQATLVVSNAGGAVLQGTAAIDSGPFAILSGRPFNLTPSDATNLVINFAPMSPGAWSNVVAFTSTGGTSLHPILGRAAETPAIVLLSLSGSAFAFSFGTTPGLAYVVQYKDSLDDPAWQILQSLPGDGTTKTITNSLSTPSQRFYRLVVQ